MDQLVEPTDRPSALDDLQRAFRMLRDSKPTVLTHPDDYERVKEAAADKWVVVEPSPYVDAGSMLYLAPLAECWRAVGSVPVTPKETKQ